MLADTIFLTGPFEDSFIILDSNFETNWAGQYGGAIHVGTYYHTQSQTYRPGKFILDRSIITGNVAGSQDNAPFFYAKGGGVYIYQRNSLYPSGAEYRDGIEAFITGSHISDNVSYGDGGGLHISTSNTGVEVRDSAITGNIASKDGGGMWLNAYGVDPYYDGNEDLNSIIITNSTVAFNTALSGGGIRTNGFETLIRHTTITRNIAGPSSQPDTPIQLSYHHPHYEMGYEADSSGGGIMYDVSSGTGIREEGDEEFSLYHTIIVGNIHIVNEEGEPFAEEPPIDYVILDDSNEIGLSDGYYPKDFLETPLSESRFVLRGDYVLVGTGGHLGYIPDGSEEDAYLLEADFGPLGHSEFNLEDFEVFQMDEFNKPFLRSDLGKPPIVPIHPLRRAADRGDEELDATYFESIDPHLDFDQRQSPFGRVGDADNQVAGGEIIDIGAHEYHNWENDLPCPPGDYNRDGSVNIADYVIYRNMEGRTGLIPFQGADGNGDGSVTAADYDVWAENFGSTCEEMMTGQLPILPGDYNKDGTVNDYDFDLWQSTYGSTTELDADYNGNGIVDLADLQIWQEYRGTTVMDEILGDFDENGVVDMNDLALWEAQDPAADANGDMVVDQDDYDIWEENFGMMAAWIMPTLTGSTNGLPLDKPMQAPFITEVTISGSASTHDPYNFSGVTGSGAQLMTVPVAKADTLQVTFSEEVLVTSTAFTLTNIQGYTMPSVDQFTYDLDTQTASWEFDGVLPSGQYLLQLSDSIFDLDHDALDGEFTNPWSINDAAGTTSELPSGDGEAGGEFRFRYSLLAADYSHNNVVNSGDFTIWSGNNGMMSGATHGNGDGDGDGDVDQDDYDVWFGGFGGNSVNWQSSEPGMILVSTATDEDDADYSYGDVSLREALDIAATNAGHDTIVFRQDLWDSTLTLTMGQLVIDSDVTILGPGADRLAISGDDASRVFYVNSGVAATLKGLAITEGYLTGSNHGGGIRSSGDLTLDEVVVYDNHVSQHGGGLFMAAGSVSIINSTFDGNSAYTGGGARFHMPSNGPVHIVGSTFSNNDASGSGGGIHVWGQGTTEDEIWIVNSTFSGNTAFYYGGGIRAHYQDGVYLVNSTIYDNHAGTNTGGLSGVGTGISVTAQNTIIAQNTAPSNPNVSVQGGLAGSNNITSGDPDLAPLDYYGGLTKTHAIQLGSSAIDAGNAELALDANGVPLNTDGRGNAFARLAGDTVDVGAFEFGVAITVSTLADEDDGLVAAGDLSLREAIALAAQIPGADMIVFDDSLFAEGPQTMELVDGPDGGSIPDQLEILTSVTIQGPGADLLTVDGNGGRVFYVYGYGTTLDATIRDLSVTGGGGVTDGGGVYLGYADLVLDSVRIFDNSAYYGGGVHNYWGNLEIVDSEISENVANLAGAGISHISDVTNGSLVVRNTTISGNDAGATSGEGGGIFGLVNATIVNSTITGNIARYGGGLFDDGYYTPTPDIYNSVIAGNLGLSSSDNDLDGDWDVDESANNLIGPGIFAGYDDPESFEDDIFLDDPADARLAPLGFNGGPTKTHALYYDSPAIDAGDDAIAIAFSLLYDQRGKNRFDDGDFDDDVVVDIGAFEVAFGKYYGAA